jgi:ectoine hydroxylase-related dioxygenase (phytanoyl-CoA dioxygenase family)
VAKAGSVLVFDNRLWHKGGRNLSSGKRAFLGVKYIPSWLNIHIRRPDSVEHRIQAESVGAFWGHWPFVDSAVFDALPVRW